MGGDQYAEACVRWGR